MKDNRDSMEMFFLKLATASKKVGDTPVTSDKFVVLAVDSGLPMHPSEFAGKREEYPIYFAVDKGRNPECHAFELMSAGMAAWRHYNELMDTTAKISRARFG